MLMFDVKWFFNSTLNSSWNWNGIILKSKQNIFESNYRIVLKFKIKGSQVWRQIVTKSDVKCFWSLTSDYVLESDMDRILRPN